MAELWGRESFARVIVARRRIRGLRELSDRLFPLEVQSTGAHGDWPITGWAMLARMGGTADSVVALIGQRRATDAAVLTRTLFESAVTFTWIGIDPTAHSPAWVRWDRRHRLSADKDVVESGGVSLLEPDTRRSFEAIVDAGPAMPNLAHRATEVDRYWGPRLVGFVEDPASPGSMRGLYRYIFRRDSQHTHAAVASVEPLILGSLPGPFRVISVEKDPGPTSAFTIAPILYGLALIAAEPILGIRGLANAVDQVFASHPEPA